MTYPGKRRREIRAEAASLPALLARLSTDEYCAPVYCRRDFQAIDTFQRSASIDSWRIDQTLAQYNSSRRGTAASLCAINAAAGKTFYRVGSSASLDLEEADEVFQSNHFVIDVQTHFVASHRTRLSGATAVHRFIQQVAPELFSGLHLQTDLSFGDYLRCVFLESETALAVLTSAPGTEETNILSNTEIAATRELIDRLAGTGRLLHHSIVHPNLPGELERMAGIVERCRPDGFKVYTQFGPASDGRESSNGWMLDDEQSGLPFLQRAQQLGVKIICAHKGLSGLAATGSPRDIGPAAAAFPDLLFLVYHSGYEVPRTDGEYEYGERDFTEGIRQQGTDRLIQSLRDAGIGPGANVYAELGSTWYILIKRPEEAVHVLGKLLLALGEDNILWGTDSVWYGSTQPLIDAFRAFHIPEEYQERYGYPALTDLAKAKILGLNATSVYGVDQARMLRRTNNDNLAWIKAAIAEARSHNI